MLPSSRSVRGSTSLIWKFLAKGKDNGEIRLIFKKTCVCATEILRHNDKLTTVKSSIAARGQKKKSTYQRKIHI